MFSNIYCPCLVTVSLYVHSMWNYKSISFFCFGQYFLFHIFMPGKGNLWKILLGCAIFEFDFIVHLLLLLLRGCWNHASYFCLLWWFYRSWADWFRVATSSMDFFLVLKNLAATLNICSIRWEDRATWLINL